MPDNDRWRNDPERYRYRDEDRQRGEGDWGYPRERRGEYRGGGMSGADRESWYAAGNGDYRPEADRDYGGGYGAGRQRRSLSQPRLPRGLPRRFPRLERDYGDSAGYGAGGSALDWRDVGDDRRDWERGRREPGSPTSLSGTASAWP